MTVKHIKADRRVLDPSKARDLTDCLW